VVHEHPDLDGTPVEIEVFAEEAVAVGEAAVPVALIELYLPGEAPRRIAVAAAAFDKFAKATPMSELLDSAPPARRTVKSAAAGSGRPDRMNYSSIEHAGRPHCGKVTDDEKRLVREHLDDVNERLAAAGLREISLDDPEHVERYDLADLARDRRPSPIALAV
jgi:hypothetical protein